MKLNFNVDVTGGLMVHYYKNGEKVKQESLIEKHCIIDEEDYVATEARFGGVVIQKVIHKTYDFVGDIHGHADELKALLRKLGYELRDSATQPYYASDYRSVVFVGDYIDRGPKIKETLAIVKAMVDNNRAIALMGNHEYNAICYNTKGNDGEPLRAHSAKNKKQHKATLDQFENDPDSYQAYIEWFKTLPLYYETDNWRAVHACWDEKIIIQLRGVLKNDRLTEKQIIQSADDSNPLWEWVEITLKGKELSLPKDVTFNDKDGHPRDAVRIKWWIAPKDKTYQDLRVNIEYDVPTVKVDAKDKLFDAIYPTDAKPVFFGHYWLRGEPSLQADNVCCLDYSVAKKGSLVSYSLAHHYFNQKYGNRLNEVYLNYVSTPEQNKVKNIEEFIKLEKTDKVYISIMEITYIKIHVPEGNWKIIKTLPLSATEQDIETAIEGIYNDEKFFAQCHDCKDVFLASDIHEYTKGTLSCSGCAVSLHGVVF